MVDGRWPGVTANLEVYRPESVTDHPRTVVNIRKSLVHMLTSFQVQAEAKPCQRPCTSTEWKSGSAERPLIEPLFDQRPPALAGVGELGRPQWEGSVNAPSSFEDTLSPFLFGRKIPKAPKRYCPFACMY